MTDPMARPLHHLCADKDLASIARYGLDPRYSREPDHRERMVYLSADASHAAAYVGHHDDDQKATLLRVRPSDLRTMLLCADNVDLPDLLDPDEDGREWQDVGWDESLVMSGQCGYRGIIPPDLIEAIRCRGGRPSGEWMPLNRYVSRHELDSGSRRDASFEARLHARNGGDIRFVTVSPGEPFSGYQTKFEAHLEGRPIAEMTVFRCGNDGLRLTWMAVNPAFQGRGIGGMMLDRLKAIIPVECVSLEFVDVKSLGMRDLIERNLGCELTHRPALGLGRAPTREEAWSGVAPRAKGTVLASYRGTSGLIEGDDLDTALGRGPSPRP